MMMKRLILPLLFACCLFFSACFDIEETYTLNANGSYELQYDFDMGELIKMAAPFMGDSVLSAKDSKKDTTVVLGEAMPDSVKRKFNSQELALLKHTEMKVKVDLPNELMKTSVRNTGKSVDELQYFLKNFSGIAKKAEIDRLLGDKTKAMGGSATESSLPFADGDLDYVITATTFERKTNAERFKAKAKTDDMAMEMLKGMGLKMTHTLVINLPRPAKSVNDPKAQLSADKKQVKLTTNVMELAEKPAIQHLLINY